MSESKPAGSLADRITKPAVAPASTSWADELASPVEPATDTPKIDGAQGDAQADGASESQGGGALQDVEHDVEVKLSDIQADVNSPLYSIQSFEQLGMLVPSPHNFYSFQ